MKERPILFSAPMVQAILAGRKTQTRRVMKPQPNPVEYDGMYMWHPYVWGAVSKSAVRLPPCSYGQPGDRLWVRETWKPWPNSAGAELRGPDGDGAIYAATWDKSGGHHWKPSIHMPRKFSRIMLEITNVRIEQLQDISEADAKAEGVQQYGHFSRPLGSKEPHTQVTARDALCALWDAINGQRGYAWETNPWVWVVGFRQLDDTAISSEATR